MFGNTVEKIEKLAQKGIGFAELTLHVGILLLLLGNLRLDLREFTLLLPPLVKAGHQHDRQNRGDDQDDDDSLN